MTRYDFVFVSESSLQFRLRQVLDLSIRESIQRTVEFHDTRNSCVIIRYVLVIMYVLESYSMLWWPT